MLYIFLFLKRIVLHYFRKASGAGERSVTLTIVDLLVITVRTESTGICVDWWVVGRRRAQCKRVGYRSRHSGRNVAVSNGNTVELWLLVHSIEPPIYFESELGYRLVLKPATRGELAGSSWRERLPWQSHYLKYIFLIICKVTTVVQYLKTYEVSGQWESGRDWTCPGRLQSHKTMRPVDVCLMEYYLFSTIEPSAGRIVTKQQHEILTVLPSARIIRSPHTSSC